MTKIELMNINKRGYQYNNNLATLLKNNSTILTAADAYNLYESIKNDYDNADIALCLSFEILRINKENKTKDRII
ncbi:hypothetical protein UFOVP455_21 [uncultured Caudovirales phage]|uniref:Uncharacterized protein n=1 Tax=uncultured Caudovirales phage TaxID=2100421 RepID=A0A6J5MCV8_9CAUD|nr:hypothetical protein UFOVP455_21 [uncultured Caudovirales phage]